MRTDLQTKGSAIEIRGIIPPLITAFDEKGRFNEKAQREIVAFLVE